MGEHERELHGRESLKLKTMKKKQQSAQSSDSDDHKPPPWSPSPAASSPPPPPAHKIPKTLTFNSAILSDFEKKTTTTLHTKSRENTCGTKFTIPNNAKNRRIGVWRIRAAASQRPRQLIRLRFLSKTGFPSVEWITVDYALLECALGSRANPGMPAHVFHNA